MASSPKLQQPPSHPVVRSAGPTPALAVPASGTDAFPYRLLKRSLDLSVAILGLVLTLPLFPVIAVLIKLDSKGRVFFAQKRVGRHGHLFTCYKFRSMVADAENQKVKLAALNEASGPAFKIRQDPRITAIGSFLRRSSLDEMPQLFNVLLGQMSVVGPRPQIPTEVELYEPWHRARLVVKPGITCLWQISGRSQVGFDEWMRLDLEYIRRRSLRTDLFILLRTLPAVMARKGAY